MAGLPSEGTLREAEETMSVPMLPECSTLKYHISDA